MKYKLRYVDGREVLGEFSAEFVIPDIILVGLDYFMRTRYYVVGGDGVFDYTESLAYCLSDGQFINTLPINQQE